MKRLLKKFEVVFINSMTYRLFKEYTDDSTEATYSSRISDVLRAFFELRTGRPTSDNGQDKLIDKTERKLQKLKSKYGSRKKASAKNKPKRVRTGKDV